MTPSAVVPPLNAEPFIAATARDIYNTGMDERTTFAVPVNRGRNAALNGTGQLVASQHMRPGRPTEATHLMKFGVNSPVGSMTCPSSFTGLSIAKAARIFAIARHSMSRAKWRPGQALLPKPKASMGSGRSSFRVPSSFSQRLGLNDSGSGYCVSSYHHRLPS